MKKELIGIFVCMLLVGTVFPVAGNVIIYNNNLSLTSGNILYVGGDGPGNYTKIQDAIDDSNNGDIIFVFNDSSPYNESIIISKEITLLGEDRATTILDGRGLSNYIISITSDEVTISGFTIQNTSEKMDCDGIRIIGDNITIEGNIIKNIDNFYGIRILYNEEKNEYIRIIDNIFQNNFNAIEMMTTENLEIKSNVFKEHWGAILSQLYNNNVTIISNIIDNCGLGIDIFGNNNIISGNSISNQYYHLHTAAIRLAGSNNQIVNNNFFNNRCNAIGSYINTKNLWEGNYWDDWIGFKYPQLGFFPYFEFRLFRFVIDWHPAREPYDIKI